MNKNYYLDNNNVLVENEYGDLKKYESNENINSVLTLNNLIENTENRIRNISNNRDKYINNEKKSFRLKYYAFTVLVSAILTLYTMIPLLILKSSIIVSSFAPTQRLLFILFSLIGPVVASTSIMTIIGENIILPKKVNKINNRINARLSKLNELINLYNLDLSKIKSNYNEKSDLENMNKEFDNSYKYVFNDDILKTPYKYVDVSKDKNNTFVKKKII